MTIVQKEITKYIALLDNSQQEALLSFIKTLTKASDKGKPSLELLQNIGKISDEDAQLMIDAIDDPNFGCNKVDENEW